MNTVRQSYSTKAKELSNEFSRGGLPGVYKIRKSILEERSQQYHSVDSDRSQKLPTPTPRAAEFVRKY